MRTDDFGTPRASAMAAHTAAFACPRSGAAATWTESSAPDQPQHAFELAFGVTLTPNTTPTALIDLLDIQVVVHRARCTEVDLELGDLEPRLLLGDIGRRHLAELDALHESRTRRLDGRHRRPLL